MPHKLDVTFELVTPAYAGGADQALTDGLRPPTLKALLRFWWRTMHPELSSEALFQAESRIFGSTSIGQGLRVVPITSPVAVPESNAPKYIPNPPTKEKPNPSYPLYYMVYGGDTYGDEQAQKHPRPRIAAGTTFQYRLCCSGSDEDWGEVKAALWLLSAFGGFGSRSRRGFGSLQILETKEDNVRFPGGIAKLPSLRSAKSSIELSQLIGDGVRQLVTKLATPSADHSAFTHASRAVVGPSFSTGKEGLHAWETALKEAALIYHGLRRMLGTSYNHVARGKPEGEDFDLIVRYLQGAPNANGSASSTFGAACGLPHNYKFSNGEMAIEEVFSPSDIQKNNQKGSARRASPIIFKVVKLMNGVHMPVVLWLPSLFLPTGYEVHYRDRRSNINLQFPEADAIAALFSKTPVDFWVWVNDVKKTKSAPSFIQSPGWQEVTW